MIFTHFGISGPTILSASAHLAKYKEIENYMNDINSVDEETGKRIKKLHDNNQHKFNTPTYRREK